MMILTRFYRSKQHKLFRLLLGVVLVAGLLVACRGREEVPETTENSVETSVEIPQTTREPVPETTLEATTQPAIEETEVPEPQEIRYTLTFAGDCTLGNFKGDYGSPGSFLEVVGKNYEHPFLLVKPWFAMDDFTLVNFEGTLTTSTAAVEKQFNFFAPPEYAQVLTTGSVECVNLANNHSYDFGETGYQDTRDALNRYGIPFVENRGTCLYPTDRGLVIGIYAAQFSVDTEDMREKIAGLRADGAEIVIVSFHWGIERMYTPTYDQISYAHTAIDVGADIVFGHHPHVLQPVELYNGGVIYYSLGNFSFGGNINPSDWDTAVLQQEIIRAVDGTVSLGTLTAVPCHLSSGQVLNNYQPKPLQAGSQDYQEVLEKLGMEQNTLDCSVAMP